MFQGEWGRAVYRYEGLKAWDAQGRALTCRILEQNTTARSAELAIALNTAGALYPITVDPIVYGSELRLSPSDGTAGDYFSQAVALDGDLAIVTAWGAGAVYFFARNEGGENNWGQLKKLIGHTGEAFGPAVALDGDLAIVTAWGANTAYIFARNEGGENNWGQLKKLIAADGAEEDYFGSAVALEGDLAVVTAKGGNAAYIFARNEGGENNWGQLKKLIAADHGLNDYFGSAVASAGDAIVVGAQGKQIGANQFQGAAYIFARNEGGENNWGQVKRLTAADGSAYNLFGSAVASAGDKILIGALGANAYQGAAYIFARNEGGENNWGQLIQLTANDGEPGDQFSSSLAIAGNLILVGAPQKQIGVKPLQGAAYIFKLSSTMALLGTNGASIASAEAASAAKGTDFGSLPWGAAQTNTFTITNSSNGPLTLDSVTTNGAGATGFSLPDLPATLAAKSAANFSILFAPTHAGAYTAAVAIVNDSMTSPYIIYLAGALEPEPLANGWLKIQLTPASAPWQLTAPAGYSGPKTGRGSLAASLALTGRYTLNFGELAGYLAPDPQTQRISAAATSVFSAVYLRVSPKIAAPKDLTATEGTYTNFIRVSWQKVAGASGYEVWRSRQSDPATAARLAKIAATASSGYRYNDYAIKPIQPYYYWVRATTSSLISSPSHTALGYAALTPNQKTGTADLAIKDLVYLPVNLTNGSPAGTVSCRLSNQGPSRLNNSPVALDFHMASAAAEQLWIGSAVGYYTLAAGAEKLVILTPEQKRTLVVPADLAGEQRLLVTARHLSTLEDPNRANNTVQAAGTVKVKPAGANSLGRGRNDYDGDGKADCELYLNALGRWYGVLSGARYADLAWAGDLGAGWAPTPGDYDGDGKVDIAAYHPAAGQWVMLLSSNAKVVGYQLGAPDCQAFAADVDGDGKSDLGVYRAEDGLLAIRCSANGYQISYLIPFGGPGYQPVLADYDGDGLADPAIYQAASGTWLLALSGSAYRLVGLSFGGPGYQPAVADYDGDGLADPALYAPGLASWQALLSGMGHGRWSGNLGGASCLPMPADYDGDGKADLALYYQDSGLWQLYLSANGYRELSGNFGGPEYQPLTE